VIARHSAFAAAALLASGTLLLVKLHAGNRPTGSIEVDRRLGEVRISATIYPSAMTRPFGVKGHHAIVWKEGRAAPWALFRSDVSDHQVRLALHTLGAKPGENLTAESWNERRNPKSPEPDKRVEGTPVSVSVRWANGSEEPISKLIAEKGGPAGLDFRYGGNERFQPQFRSGCIVCLYSCPGGAIGNRTRTIRDYVRQGVIYSVRNTVVPAKGTRAIIILKPHLEAR